MKFIESLIKNKFSMLLTDSEEQTPLAYILQDNVPEEALVPVVQIIMKYGFNILRNMKAHHDDVDSEEGEPDLKESFLMELFEKGKMTLKLFKLIAPLLK